MPTWVLYLLGAVFIVSAVGGGYLWLDSTLKHKDKQIEDLRSEVAAQKLDIADLQATVIVANKTIARQKSDISSFQEQVNRIRQADAIERGRQADLERRIQGATSQNATDLAKINEYQKCVAKDTLNTKCLELLP